VNRKTNEETPERQSGWLKKPVGMEQQEKIRFSTLLVVTRVVGDWGYCGRQPLIPALKLDLNN
jgi:hypothetical protein